MDSLADAVGAADSVWSVIAIALIGLYVLAWRYGGEILRTTRESNGVAKQAHTKVQQISEEIVTNHGSDHLGHAIDRLTQWMLMHMEESREGKAELSRLREEFVFQFAATENNMQVIRDTFAQHDDRLTELEVRRG